MMEETTRKPLTIGQKIERIRSFRGFKQVYVASRLNISQQQFSKIEQQDEIEDHLLNQIAEILGVTPEAIKNFDDDRMTYIINHQYNIYNNEIKDNASNNFIFNPIDKIAELYERLLISEREKNDLKKNNE